MTLALLVYLAGVLHGVQFVFVLCGIALAVISLMGVFDNCKKSAVKYGTAAAIVFLIAALIPSEKTMYVMAGAYATQQIAENPNVQRIGGKIVTVIDKKLDEIIDEGVSKVKESTR